MNELETVLDLLMQPGFQGGLVAGVVVLGLLFGISAATGTRPTGWALGFAAAVALVLSFQFSTNPLVIGSLAVVALAGLSVDLAHTLGPGPVGVVARVVSWGLTVVSVSWFASTSNTSDDPWISIAFPLVVIAMGAAIWSYRYSPHADLLGPIVTVTILGVWVTVPETDMFTIVVGASLPLALGTLAPVRARAGGIGAFAIAAMIAWLTIAGGETRPLSVIGGWAAFGVLPLIPLLRLLRVNVHRPYVVLGVHVGYAVLATRVVDIWTSIPVSLSVIGALIVVSGAALAVFGRAEIEEPSVEAVVS